MATVQKPVWKNKWLATFIVVAVLIAAAFMYRSYAAWRNERDFAQARAAIDTVYADIVTKVGQPDNYKRTNDCSRPSQEFGQGPLSCSVGTDFIYGVDNETQANDLFKQIQSVIASHSDLFKPTKPLSAQITDASVGVNSYHESLDYYKEKGSISCVASYIYDTSSLINLTVKEAGKKPIESGISCSSLANKQYYPLEH